MQTLSPYNHPDYHDLPSSFPPDYADVWGEDQQGVWIEVIFEGITQRFRWIPKGQFTMGSPDDEKERSDGNIWGKETLHEVTLTQGFWLADIACTQTLWQAMMGENPSHFDNDPQNPVEQVSWIDAQNFLAKLNQSISNLKAHLPTEAQWEYACRAGTVTPFSFEKNISPDLVNYNGNYPYADGKKGEHRKKTVPVKALPANPWGLYQMHGNVWEWCFDEFQEDLGAEPMQNPVNASFKSGVKPDNARLKTGSRTAKSSTTLENTSVYDSTLLANADDGVVKRVLRGGAWIDFGRHCRSAIRRRADADFRYRSLGFRFALGH